MPTSGVVSDETMIVRNPFFIELPGNQTRRIGTWKDVAGGFVYVDVIASDSGDACLCIRTWGRLLLANAHSSKPAVAAKVLNELAFARAAKKRAADAARREDNMLEGQRRWCEGKGFGLVTFDERDAIIAERKAVQDAKAEAIAKAFALNDDDLQGPNRGRDALSPEQREQHFVRELQTMSRLSGETGRFYSAALEFVDGGGEGGSGAQAEFLRKMDGQLERLDAVLQQLPRITEERLEEYENEPDEVRTYLSKQLDAWKERSAKAKQEVLVEARMLARELAGADHEHSLGKLVDGTGALRKRYLYIRLESTLRERQGKADSTLREAKGRLDGWEERFRKFNPDMISPPGARFLN